MATPQGEGDDEETPADGEEEAEAAAPAPEPEMEAIDPAELARVRTPDQRKREIFAIADQLLGGSRIRVMCADGKSRMARIPGKLRRRMWIREGDLLIVQPWDFQDDKADVVYRYMKIQAHHLSKRGLIPKEINIF